MLNLTNPLVKSVRAATLALALGLATGCETVPSTQGATSWIAASKSGNPVALNYETPAANQSLAWSYFEAGEYLLTLGDGGGDTIEAKLFRKTELPGGLNAQLKLSITEAGHYQVLLNREGTPNVRITKKVVTADVASATTPAQKPLPVCLAATSPITVSMSGVFSDGEWVKDYYSGQKAQVTGGQVTLTPAPESEGLLLLEAAEAPAGDFSWDNATVYFVITDRFANGRTDNDNSYGRKRDGKQDIGTFHGGDFAGLTKRLDYLQTLGVNALWLSPPFEQAHGWVGGGDRGDFKHYAYHGYYALDFTRLDANMGTEEELKTLIAEAHKRGIRVLFDVVMNHPGYGTLQDMQDYGFGGIHAGFDAYLPARWGDWEPKAGENFHAYHSLINYDHPDWANWWGKDWVRAGIFDYDTAPNAGIDPVKGSLAFLPDFKTESTATVDLPVFLKNKPDTGATAIPGATVRQHLINWLTRWVRDYGLDGFRVDTVKHVEPEAWAQLKQASVAALQEYRSRNPGGFTDEFWMVGEVFPHGVTKSAYFDAGFDAVINFDFQRRYATKGANCIASLEPVFSEYAQSLNSDPAFNVMTYISSHDTELFNTRAKDDASLQKKAAAALLLPGAVQVFYGDESGRRKGPTGSDPMQGTRSDMNWDEVDNGKANPTLQHWQKLGQFRARHPSVGAGSHQQISEIPYTFARVKGGDRVVIVQSTQ
jgi:alpha-amylase